MQDGLKVWMNSIIMNIGNNLILTLKKLRTMNKVYYFISNSDNQIHKTNDSDLLCKIEEKGNVNIIQILTSNDEIIDEVIGFESLGDLRDFINGCDDLE